MITRMNNVLVLFSEKHLNLVDNSLAFNKLLAGIGVEDAKSSGLDFFNLEQAKLISQYIFSR